MKSKQILAMQYHTSYQTSHVLHLILSIVTGGLWILPWIIISFMNSLGRSRIERQIKKLEMMENRS